MVGPAIAGQVAASRLTLSAGTTGHSKRRKLENRSVTTRSGWDPNHRRAEFGGGALNHSSVCFSVALNHCHPLFRCYLRWRRPLFG